MYFSIYSNAPFRTKQELFNTQHDTLESYERQFASLRQCCSGTASDLSSFEAKTLAILKRMEERGRLLAADVWSEPGGGELKSGNGHKSKLSFLVFCTNSTTVDGKTCELNHGQPNSAGGMWEL